MPKFLPYVLVTYLNGQVSRQVGVILELTDKVVECGCGIGFISGFTVFVVAFIVVIILMALQERS
jgi:hypothetical protein